MGRELLNFLNDMIKHLTDEDINFILKNQEVALGLITSALQNRQDPIFKVVEQVEISATTKNFVVKDSFGVNEKGAVPILFVSDFFKGCFFGKIEDPMPASILIVRGLLKPRNDDENIAALGGRDKTAITLREFYEYLKTADRTKWHIAYIFVNGTLRCVNAYWCSRGWRVRAYSVDGPCRLDEGHYVVSRNS